jgi:predicted SAM-dependent methyltransferase
MAEAGSRAMTEPPLRLNLGCGNLHLSGYLGVDSKPGPNVDILWDLRRHPWPWTENSAEHVIAWHVLEHLPGDELATAMDEIHRILVRGGLLYVKVPYLERYLDNPFHHHQFSRTTFDVWVERPSDGPPEGSLQYQPGYFRRAAQDVVSLSGFPVWHLVHRLSWTEGALFHRDERGPWSRIPSRVRELREWLVKL